MLRFLPHPWVYHKENSLNGILNIFSPTSGQKGPKYIFFQIVINITQDSSIYLFL